VVAQRAGIVITWGTAAAALAAPLVFLLPGWALLSLLLPPERLAERRPDAASWLILAAGLTLALVPVALLFLYLVGLKVGTGVVLAGLALSALVILWRRGPVWWARRPQPVRWRALTQIPGAGLAWLDPPLLALLAVMALVFGVRLWVVRGINVGFWGDSYQHTLITQLVLDNGGLYQSWQPYAPLTTFTYHFGLHGDVAFFQWATGWLTGNPTPRTVVLAGQFLNGLAALALYPLAVRLCRGKGPIPDGRGRWAGVLAVLVAGLLTPMPMFYVNWGRYTQLAGQVILPVALWLTLEAVEADGWDPRRLGLAVLAVAGLALTHYLVLAFYVVFWPFYLIVWSLGRRAQPRSALTAWLRLAVVGLGAVLLVVPWAALVLKGLLPRILGGYLQGTPAEDFLREETRFYPLVQFLPYYIAVLAALGGLWALLRRHRVSLVFLWVGSLLLLANPHRFGLPGRGVVNNFTVELALYIPAAILCAYLVVSAVELVADYFAGRRTTVSSVPLASRVSLPEPHVVGGPRSLVLLAALAIVLAVAWAGVQQRKGVIDPAYQLVTPADEQALAWVRHNTPPGASFLVNSFFAYGGSLIAGSDAGWWLPLLAGRPSTQPPLNYGSEAGPDPGYGQRVNDLALRLEQSNLADAATVRYLRQQGVSYVFIGEKGGDLLDPALLQGSPYYQAVLEPPPGAAGPWIFEIILP
jgi:Family of unknown function (DUF6541)